MTSLQGSAVALNTWLNVELHKTASTFTLIINTEVIELPSSSAELPSFDRLWVGGYSNYSTILRQTSFTKGIEGCVSEVRVIIYFINHLIL